MFKPNSSKEEKPQIGETEKANCMHRTKEPEKTTACDQTGFSLFKPAQSKVSRSEISSSCLPVGFHSPGAFPYGLERKK